MAKRLNELKLILGTGIAMIIPVLLVLIAQFVLSVVWLIGWIRKSIKN